jgi:quercetin dioxygenase-like cupin family protein
MEILSFDRALGHEITAHGSTGFAVQALVRAEHVAVTVLHVAAGGEIGRHPATVDQLLLITAGRGRVQGGDGEWREVATGDAVLWTAGENHVTRADEPITAIGIEMPSLPLRRPSWPS